MIALTLKDLASFMAELQDEMIRVGEKTDEAIIIIMGESGNMWVRNLVTSNTSLMSRIGLLEYAKSLMLGDSLMVIDDDLDDDDDEEAEEHAR